MAERYVILRREATDPFAGTLSEGGTPAPTEIKVEIAELDRSEESDLRRDKRVDTAPVMEVRLIEPTTTAGPTGTEGTATWGVEAVGATRSHLSGQGITVAVLDTGIHRAHPAFSAFDAGRLIEKDFTGQGNGDENGHGTHCAGTIFGGDIDGLRIGIARGIKCALIGKILDKKGRGSTGQIVDAIDWAIKAGANVISMSLSIDFPGYVRRLVEKDDLPVELATSRALTAYRANVRLLDRLVALIEAREARNATILIAASGNESEHKKNLVLNAGPPAAADGVIAVGALGKSGSDFEVADFSNSGVHIAGPGVGVISAAAGGGLKSLSGTSMATPHVAGVAALWAEGILSETGQLDAGQLKAFILARADRSKINGNPDVLDIGTGLVQAPLA